MLLLLARLFTFDEKVLDELLGDVGVELKKSKESNEADETAKCI